MGRMHCNLYRGPFSGEVVFEVKTTSGQSYEGIAPKHYARQAGDQTHDPAQGDIEVRVLRSGNGSTRVRLPDGEALDVPSEAVESGQ